ncbi:hypothetical protein HPB47_018041, partial [Ixodes persulcatus]
IARPKTKCTAHQHSLLPETTVDWNGLPDNIVTITDNTKFRLALNPHSPL